MSYKLIKYVALVALVLPAFLSAVAKNSADIKNAVVRVEVVSQAPNYTDPWKMNTDVSGSGSGCVIASNHILTSAHLIANQIYIKVQKAGDAEKYTAEVEFVAHDCDLALLKVKDPEFFKGVTSIGMGTLPKEGDKVNVFGFPSGGSKISVTQGVVSRIEMGIYSHSLKKLLNIQIDAAINSGNSGGPVLLNGRLAGIAFQVQKDSENIGYIIPVPIIEHFLRDISDGRYDGFPTLGIQFQDLESPAMRFFFKMKEKQTGVYIRSVDYGSSAWGAIEEGDVLLALDGVPVANDGSVEFAEKERIDCTYLLNRFQAGDSFRVTLLRGGVEMEKALTLRLPERLVPFYIYDRTPDYLIFAGLVFMPVTLDYLQIWGVNSAPTELAYMYKYGKSRKDYSQVVVLNKVLAHDFNEGYQNLSDMIVTRVNGQAIGRLADVAAAFSAPRDSFHLVELANGYKIILDAAGVEKAHKEILAKYKIPKDRSDNLK
jgi:S1-C subfamily serine protease